MVSSTLSKNIYANKISANLINANQIKANKIISNSQNPSPSNIPSYLFSMDINDASYDSSTQSTGILSFSKDSVIDIIEFSDRPLRYSRDITIEEFDELFSEGISDNFTEQKPNLVLYLPNTGQNSFELTKFEVKNGTINYTLQNIGTQTINIPSFNNQRISLFVDNLTQAQILQNILDEHQRNSGKPMLIVYDLTSFLLSYQALSFIVDDGTYTPISNPSFAGNRVYPATKMTISYSYIDEKNNENVINDTIELSTSDINYVLS